MSSVASSSVPLKLGPTFLLVQPIGRGGLHAGFVTLSPAGDVYVAVSLQALAAHFDVRGKPPVPVGVAG